MPSSRRAPLSRDRILRAAIKLADRHGLEALSMRKLATTLKVEAMSLYNHVANKDELLDGMVDVVIGEIMRPTPGSDWKAAMRARAHSALAVMTAHPWAPMLVVSRISVGPNMLAYLDATLGTLREAGFSWHETDRAWNAMDNYTYGFALQQQNFPVNPDEYASAAAAYLPMLPASLYPYMHEITVRVADGSHDGTLDFAFGLELILDGLERVRGARP
ncbi:TetR/AcrR family transcriptional regulator [Gemmatimonas sp. UBA7669]|jgi:AcrR family transcriptional regulator|uniref:TetR/AcrR family transcriptional regulator n=1 Tax=Gemmatimonas sp. UBA7669 TaxID=1946568 RepID=UPI0025C4340A|nr:TetR/AcrR family transcriptional regulator [Gemmatimonas sp. UBA7669]